ADNPTTDTDPTGLSSQYNTNGGCATLRNCNDDRQSLDHPPGQELNSGTSTNQANMLTNKTQGQTVRVMKVDINKMAAYIKAHAKAHSTGWCGRACRMAFTKGGGINAKSWPAHAGDYGPFLRAHGASVVPRKNYKAEKGDVIVFDRTSAHRSGHIEIYNGKNWDSDFSQKNMIPYSTDVPPYTIYRFPGDN
ncbi:MAG TPA: hypothetical protein VMW54_10760, partial [Terriglobia bacterium]|nr:hypothetical protein [Terriglobia bacterium]